jgi:hypothetical protein
MHFPSLAHACGTPETVPSHTFSTVLKRISFTGIPDLVENIELNTIADFNGYVIPNFFLNK